MKKIFVILPLLVSLIPSSFPFYTLSQNLSPNSSLSRKKPPRKISFTIETHVTPLEERIADVQRRMALPIERGNGWIRISASMEEAHCFHRDWKRENSEMVRFELGSQSFVFCRDALNKAIIWFEGNLDFERTGTFVGQMTETGIRIVDFVPLASYAADSAIFHADPATKQVTTTVGPNGLLNIFEVEEALGWYNSSLEITPPTGSLLYSVHSHPAWSQFPRGPSPDDQKKSRNSQALHFVYGLKEGILSIYDGQTAENVFCSKTSPQTVENSI